MQGMLSKQVNRSILSTTFLEDILKIESMLTDGIIYFVGVWLETEVHAQGLGFTNFIHYFCWGRTEGEAMESVRAFVLGNGVSVKKVASCSVANQNLRSYTFPEQIIDLPDAIAVQAIQSLGYPDGIVRNTMTSLRQRQDRLAKGRKILNEMSPAH